MHREIGNRRYEGMTLGSLGNLRLEQGRTDQARALYDAGEALLRTVGDQKGLALLLCGRARLERAEGTTEAASAALTEAEALGVAVGADPELHRELAKTRIALEVP